MGRSRTSKHARYGPGGQALRGIVAAAVVVLCLCLCASAYASRAATSPGPPVNTSVPVVKGTPKVGKKVKANAGKWSGSKPIGYSYQWKGCDTTGEACTNINGATGSSYIPTSEQVGDTLRVVVTATNSVGEASVESPPSKPVAAGVAATRIDLCGPIAKSLTLSAELAKVYVLTCTVTVPAGTTLTITPGTVIKSENSYGLSVNGSLVSQGTSSSPIVFTSLNDNSVGGKTGNGKPSAGEWGGIGSYDGGSLDLEHVAVDYARLNLEGEGGIWAEGSGGLRAVADSFKTDGISADGPASPVVEDDTFSSPEDVAVGVIATGTPTVKDNSVSDPSGEAFAVDAMELNPALLAGNTVSGAPGWFELAGRVTTSGALPSLDVPWEVGEFFAAGEGSGSCLDVPSKVTLKINPGTVVKGNGRYGGQPGNILCPGEPAAGAPISVEGTLEAVGTTSEPVIFTSLNDNSVGGKTGNGKPSAGEWGGIGSYDGGSLDLEHVAVDYARLNLEGEGGIWAEGSGGLRAVADSFKTDGISADGPASPVVEDDTFSSPEDVAVGVIATGTPTVKDNSVSDPSGEAFAVDAMELNPALLAGNTVSGAPGWFELAGRVTTSGALPSLDVPWEVGEFFAAGEGSGSCLDVPSKVTLKINPGTVVKGNGRYGGQPGNILCPGEPAAGAPISVEGTLEAVGTTSEPVIFTSLNDNSVGGKTGNGKPSAGEWGGIEASPSTEENPVVRLEHVQVRYAGTGLSATTDKKVIAEDSEFADDSTAVNIAATLGTNAAIHHDWFDDNGIALAGSSDWEPIEPCQYIPTISATENEYGPLRGSKPFISQTEQDEIAVLSLVPETEDQLPETEVGETDRLTWSALPCQPLDDEPPHVVLATLFATQ